MRTTYPSVSSPALCVEIDSNPLANRGVGNGSSQFFEVGQDADSVPFNDGFSSDAAATGAHLPRVASVDIVIPVFNEEADLEASVRSLAKYLEEAVPWTCSIIIADNASTDSTPLIGAALADQQENVSYVRLEEKGRGRALKQCWMGSQADVVAYMDVDLSTDLRALLPLMSPLISGHSDIAIGTRLSRSSRVIRGPRREFISRCYNFLIRSLMGAHFSDAQCGFKAMRTEVAVKLLPLVEDNAWFFDTETLLLAEKAGLRIHEVPVDWTDDPGTTVDIVPTALEDLRGLWRVGTGLVSGRIALDSLGIQSSDSGSTSSQSATQSGGGMPATMALERIKSEAQRMSNLVEDLLTLAKLDAERPLEKKPVDLATVALECVQAVSLQASGHTIALDVKDPVLVLGDADRLKQVATNLLTNAVKHTPQGTHVTVIVDSDNSGSWGVLIVQDDGTGMTRSDAEKAFERFTRLDSSRSRKSGGGAGLGLSIVNGIVHAHGGRIEVDTAPGKGAAFKVFLPLPEAS